MRMTSKERIIAAINNEQPDRIPIGPPFQGYWSLGVEGVCVRDSIAHPDMAAQAQLSTMRSCGFDLIETMWDWMSPVEALGCEVRIPDFGSIPTWAGIIDEPGDLDKVSIPDPGKDYRLRASMDTTRLLVNEVGGEKFLVQTMVSPFTLAGEMRGVETMMMDTAIDPDFVKSLLAKSTEVVKAYVDELVTSDADGIIMCDPTASGSLISKEYFMEFSQPYIRECGRIISSADKYLFVHICGDTSDRLEEVVDIGGDVFSVDHQVDVGKALDQVGNRITILGNVQPAQTLFSGTPANVLAESRVCIDKAAGRAFILGAGCDIAPGTPLENVEVWKEAIHQ